MNNVRHAHNLDAQANSDANGIEFNPLEDMTRAEFGYDADVNVLVKRGLPMGRQAQYGEQDLTVTLSDRHLAAHQAAQAFQNLPQAIRAKYRSWVELLQADPKDLEALTQDTPVTPEAPPASAGQTPSPASSPSPQ